MESTYWKKKQDKKEETRHSHLSAPLLNLTQAASWGISHPGECRWARGPGCSSDCMSPSSNAVTAVAWDSVCGLRASHASPTPTWAIPATTSCFPAVREKTLLSCPRSVRLRSLSLHHREVGITSPWARVYRMAGVRRRELLGLLANAGWPWPSVETLGPWPL